VSIGSIFVKHNPVTLHERYLLNLSPLADGPGFMDAGYDEYRPAERAEGGFWGTSFRIFARENVLKELFQNGLGRHVEAWGEGLQQDFEGYIDDMTFNLPPDQFSISLENMANQMWMRADTNADGVVERTTTKTSPESQDRFGIKDLVLSGGEIIGLGPANQAVQTFLDLKAFPRPEARIGGARGDRPSLEIFCRGYIHTLGWRVYNSTSPVGTQSLTSQVKTIVDAVGPFVASQDRDTNTTSVTREYDADRKAFDILFDLVRLGDTNFNRWLLYMVGRSATEPVGRKLVLREAAPAEITT
jgi:hypothetical protein